MVPINLYGSVCLALQIERKPSRREKYYNFMHWIDFPDKIKWWNQVAIGGNQHCHIAFIKYYVSNHLGSDENICLFLLKCLKFGRAIVASEALFHVLAKKKAKVRI